MGASGSGFKGNHDWPSRHIAALDEAIAEISGWETSVPVDLKAFKFRENAEEYSEGVHAAIVGPLPDRGPPTGLVVHRGDIVGAWGTPERADIAFSVTKSAVATIAGLALADGRIPALDARVSDGIDAPEFADGPNRDITWRHLLTLTSEWRGSLWNIPDSIDWNRAVPKRPDSPPKGSARQMHAPGTYWEFNDVRVNLLAYALTRLFRRPLDAVLRERVMDPIGASPDWRWTGYEGARTVCDGREIPVVAGGAHWGGGLIVSAYDLARLGLLHVRRGQWNGKAVLPAMWCDLIASPTPLSPDFGLMWWNNHRGSIAALSRRALWGSGIAMLLVVDPEKDLVIVLRWYDVPRRDRLIGRLVEAIGA